MRSTGRSRGLRALSVLASACALAVGAVVAPSPGAHADNTKAQASDQAYYSHYSLASLHAQGYTGEGVIIAVIDGRVDTTIPELQGANIEDMTPCTVQSDSSNDDHATSIAQLLVAPDFGIAPGATIYNYASVPNINDAGSDCALGSRASVLGDHSGLIEEALNDGAHIIVISSNIFSRDRESLRWAVSRAVVEGVPVVVSMGNESTRNQDRSLVLWGGVVGVAALERDGSYADYSNYGDGVSIAAVGEIRVRRASENKVDSMRGTSYAAPMVAGILALAWSRFGDDVTADQVLQAMVATARGSGGQWNERTGFGEIDPVALLSSDPSQYPSVNPFEEKGGDSMLTSADIVEYYYGLVDPSVIFNDGSYVYRGVDERVVSSGASGYPAHLGTSPLYHAE
ncbi:protease [Mycobacteroides abscessus subsp. abscessus]|nr:protease [Mycobacteroides abscessus subsp. abscessus]